MLFNNCKKKINATTLLIFFFLSSTGVFAQNKITGTITSADGAPLYPATIMVKNTGIAITTDVNGYYNITAKKAEVLVISFIGFEAKEVAIGDGNVLNIALERSIINLDEVVVVGYTSQKVKEITGSVAIVKSKELTAIPAGQVEQMLQGRVAGLNVISSGEPGSASNVRLHGIGNFGDVTPLYIIDGVEGNINSLNPYDIESLQVLKDAGAYSIYGVRGANGVIVLTTKKGRSGKTKVNYDFYTGTTRPLKKGPDILTPQEYADLTWIALKNSGQVDPITGYPSNPYYGNGLNPVLPDYLFAGHNIDTLYEGSPFVNPDLYNIDSSSGPIYQIVKFNKTGTDWFHEAFKPALSQNHTVSVSGGSDNNHYLLSFGYLDQQGTLINTSLKRFTTRVNTEFTLNKIRIGENIQFSYSKNPKTGNSIAAFLTAPPELPVHDIKGNYSSLGDAQAGPASNPLAARVLSKDDNDNSWQVFGNAYFEVDLFRKFTFRSSFGGNLNYYYAYKYSYGSYEPAPAGFPNSFTERSGYARSWTWTNTLSYSNTFLDDHNIKAFAGLEEKSNYNREQGGTRKGYFTNDPDFRFLSNGRPIDQSNYSVAGISYLYSFISQVNYAYKEKYFISGTLRRDGSSIFGSENRFGWFPAVSAAWRLTEEKFINETKWLTDLKLRASWGKTGYQGNTDPFNQYTLYGGSAGDAFYDINGTSNRPVPGFRTVRIGNAKTGWQEDIVANIGIESVLWNGKLNFTADWYNKKSRGLLFPVSLPALLGDVSVPNVNVGEVKNTGIDLLLSSKGNFSKNWSWDVSATFSHYNNKIIKLNDVPYFDDFYKDPFTLYAPLVRNEVGYPISSFYGYKIIGFFEDEADVARSPSQEAAAPGRFKYADVNGRDSIGRLTGLPDGNISVDDRLHFGDPNPAFTLGLNVGISYKNFDFSTFFYGSFGNDVLNILPQDKVRFYNSWTPQHRNAKAPIIEWDQNFSTFAAVNSYPLENGSYFRNKTMILGYALPKKWLQKIKLERLRIYIQCNNLFTITNYTGLDPELSGTGSAFGGFFGTHSAYGIDFFGNYPNNQKQWFIGFNMGF